MGRRRCKWSFVQRTTVCSLFVWQKGVGKWIRRSRSSTNWCPDCKRAKQFLGDQRIAFEWHDVELEPQGLEIVREHNNGNDVIPTVVFPDGTILSEPSNEELANKIGLDRKAMMHVYDLVLVGGGPAALTTSIYASRRTSPF